MRTVEEVIEEGLQADNWETWFRKIRNEFSAYKNKQLITRQEKKDMLKEIRQATFEKKRGKYPSIDLALAWVNTAVKSPTGKITEEDMGNRKIIQDVTLKDSARSPDFNWGAGEVWEEPLRVDGKDEEADWLLELLAHARSEEAMKIEHFNLGRIYDPFKRIDLRKYKGRQNYYNYWKGIAAHYDAEMHHDFLKALEKDIAGKDIKIKVAGKETSMQSAIDELLRIPAPQTVVTVKPIPISSLDKPLAVIEAFLERVANEKDDVNWSTTEAVQTDDSGKVTGTTPEAGAKEQLTQAEKEKQAEEQSRLADEAEELERFVEEIRTSELDPLLHFAVEEGKVKVPFTESDFDKDENRLFIRPSLEEGMKEILIAIDPQAWEEFKEMINELEESIEQVPNPPYHLPIKDIETEWEDIKEYIGDFAYGRKIIKPGSDHWEKFFELIAAIVYEVPRRFSIKQHPVKVGFGEGEASSVGGDAKAANAARTAMQSATTISFPQEREEVEYTMTPTTETKFQELLDVLISYYIEPSGSEFYYEGKPRYTEIASFINLVMKSADHPMSKRYTRIHEGNIDNFGPDDLDPISDFIEKAKNPIQGVEKIIRLGQQAVLGLDAILGPDEDNKVFVGETLYQIAHHHLDETDLIQFEGESLDYWHEVNEDSPNSVLSEIHSFMESTPIKTNLNLRDTSKPIQDSKPIKGLTVEGLGVGGETKERKMFESVKRLVTLITELKKSMDPIAMKLLHAHDMIRKMTGRNLTYARLNADDPNDVSVVMEKVPVTASEILMIVKSYDSHRNLSLNHGISENDVYVIKGMFR